MDLRGTKLSSGPVYKGSFITISHDRVRLPNGNEGRRVVVRHPGAACVLAETEDGKVVLMRRWRYTANQATLELPAGKLGVADRDPTKYALRELAEETPYVVGSIKLSYTFYTTVGFCDEKMYLYQTQSVRLGSELSDGEGEITETVLMSKEEVRNTLTNDGIKDGRTLIGLQCWLTQNRYVKQKILDGFLNTRT